MIAGPKHGFVRSFQMKPSGSLSSPAGFFVDTTSIASEDAGDKKGGGKGGRGAASFDESLAVGSVRGVLA